MRKIQIIKTGNTFSSNQSEAMTLANTKKFGELKNKKVIYSIYEALYLIEKKKAEIKNNISLNKNTKIKYIVYKNLRDKGLIPKTGLKFGADFRVYENLKVKHAKYLLFILEEKDKLKLTDLSGKTRIAHSTKKDILLAIIDNQEDVTYYEINWKKI